MEINGKKVVDATRGVTIHITAKDAADGANKNPSSCAAARAAKRDIADCLSARVHVGRVYVEHQNRWVRYMTPESLRTEIVAFDRGGTFQPGNYVLKAPAKSETQAYRQKHYYSGSDTSRNKLGSSPTKGPRKVKVAKIKRHKVSGIRPSGANR